MAITWRSAEQLAAFRFSGNSFFDGILPPNSPCFRFIIRRLRSWYRLVQPSARDLNGILRQSEVAGLGESKLPFDHPEYLFHSHPDRGVLPVTLLLILREILSAFS